MPSAAEIHTPSRMNTMTPTTLSTKTERPTELNPSNSILTSMKHWPTRPNIQSKKLLLPNFGNMCSGFLKRRHFLKMISSTTCRVKPGAAAAASLDPSRWRSKTSTTTLMCLLQGFIQGSRHLCTLSSTPQREPSASPRVSTTSILLWIRLAWVQTILKNSKLPLAKMQWNHTTALSCQGTALQTESA